MMLKILSCPGNGTILRPGSRYQAIQHHQACTVLDSHDDYDDDDYDDDDYDDDDYDDYDDYDDDPGPPGLLLP